MSRAIWILLASLWSVALQAQEHQLVWPQFHGPHGAGVAEGQNPPVELGPDKNVKWKVAVPSGSSSPIIAGDNVVVTALENGKLFTIAYRRGDGAEAWRVEAPAKQLEPYHKLEGSPAASTPATDGERIVSYFGSCGVFCYDLAGKELWRHELPTVATIGEFGTGVSPILVENTVIVVREEIKEPKIIALDASSGELKWEKKRQSVSAFATPVAWDTPDGKQVVVAGFGKMIGYDLKTGDEKWYLEGMPAACCSSPLVSDGLLYFAGWSPGGPDDKDFQMPKFDDLLKAGDTDGDGVLTKAEAEKTPLKDFFDSNDLNKDGKYTREEADMLAKFLASGQNSAFAVKPGGSGDVSTSHLLWKQTRGLPYVTSGLVYRGQMILLKDGGIVTSYDAASGKELYSARAAAAGKYYASPVAAAGRIYVVSLEDGTVTVLKAGTEKTEVLAKNPPLGERVAATPAIAGNVLYVRTAGHLYAFDAQN
jgi:outer membrane protein assembly factor BamB